MTQTCETQAPPQRRFRWANPSQKTPRSGATLKLIRLELARRVRLRRREGGWTREGSARHPQRATMSPSLRLSGRLWVTRSAQRQVERQPQGQPGVGGPARPGWGGRCDMQKTPLVCATALAARGLQTLRRSCVPRVPPPALRDFLWRRLLTPMATATCRGQPRAPVVVCQFRPCRQAPWPFALAVGQPPGLTQPSGHDADRLCLALA